MTAADGAKSLLIALILDAGISVLFYNAWIPAAAAFLPTAAAVFYLMKKREERKRTERLRRDFLQAVRVFGDSLLTGYSAANAVRESADSLGRILPGKSEVLTEWRRMGRLVGNGQTVEEVFRDFSERSGIGEIRDFSEMLAISLRSGGAVHLAVQTAVNRMSEQETVFREIRARLSGRIFEQRIMDLMPAAILLYVRVTSPELLIPMYTSPAGRAVMSVCLILYFAAVWLSERILKMQGAGVL